MEKFKESASHCGCPHCETELKRRCFEPEFCKPCGIGKKVKICGECKAEYAVEYDGCPSCAADKK